ncbi:MAG: insulinase family protein [Chloroflexi bacterium]|nr:insulinase family protein [Chloroflexota bacterium]
MAAMGHMPGPENIVTARLSNGLRVWVYENFSSASVVFDGYLPGGLACETRHEAGLASLTAGMLRRGSEARDFDALNELVEGVGASFGFGCGRHVLSFSGRCLAEDAEMVFGLLAESLMRPAFDKRQFEQLHAQTLTGIRERRFNPRTMAYLTFRERVFPADHPYARPISGYEETVARLTVEDVQRYYERFIGPSAGVVVVVGAIHAAEALNLLEKTVGAWKAASSCQDQVSRPESQVEGQVEKRLVIPEKSQTSVVVGWPGIHRRHPDFMPVVVCNQILGRFGMGGRLGARVREREGLAYYVYSSFSANRLGGTWYAAAGVNPQDAARAVAGMLAEVARMVTDPVSAEELADAQAKLTGSLPLGLETNAGIADDLLDMAWYDLGLDYLQTYSQRVNAVTREDVLRVARSYLDPERYVLVEAGPGGG